MEHLNLIKNDILNINISDQVRVVDIRLIMYGTLVARLSAGFQITACLKQAPGVRASTNQLAPGLNYKLRW